MEEVIQKIIDIEKRAQEVISSAEKEKEQKEKSLKKNLQDLKEKILDDAQEKVVKIRERELEYVQAEAEEKVEGCSMQLKQMEDYYAEHFDEWCNELYKAVLKR